MSDTDTPSGGTANAGENKQGASSQMFTQEQVNSMLAQERRKEAAKYEGYADYKAQAEEYANLKDKDKSELQKVREELDAVTKERDGLKSAQERASWVNEVAMETKVPANTVAMLSGATKEELLEQAKTLAPDFGQPVSSEGNRPPETEASDKAKFACELFGSK